MKITTHPPQTRQDSIVILTTPDGKLLTKKHRRAGAAWTTTDYDRAFLFRASTAPLESLSDLSAVLALLQHDKRACVVRGALAEPDSTRLIQRKIHGAGASLTRADHHWIGFDLDDVPAPQGLKPGEPESLREAVRFAIVETLPKAFHGAACVYSWTSSAGIKGWSKLRLRVWFWGDRLVCDDSLKAGFAGLNVDRALFNPAQIHYTAAPVFEGAPDPLAGVRFGELPGAPVVVFPAYLLNQSDHNAKLERDKPKRQAVDIIEADSVDVRRRLEGEADKVRERISGAGVGERHAAILRGAVRFAGLVKAGYLNEAQALAILDEAASNVLHGERDGGREAVEAFAWAMREVKPRKLTKQSATVDTVERHATLELARAELSNVTRIAFETPGIHTIKAPPGTGKTHAVTDSGFGVGVQLVSGERVLFASPTVHTRGEVHGKIRTSAMRAAAGVELSQLDLINRGIIEQTTRTSDNCTKLDVFSKVASKAPGAGSEFCNACTNHPSNGGKCPFIQARGALTDLEKARALSVTHESLVNDWGTDGLQAYATETRWRELGVLGGERVRPVLRYTPRTNAITATPDAHGILLPTIDYTFDEDGNKVYKPTDDQKDDVLSALADWLFCEPEPLAIAFELSARGDVQTAFSRLIIDEDVSGSLVKDVSLTLEQLESARRSGDLDFDETAGRVLGDLLDASKRANEHGYTPHFTANDITARLGFNFLTMPNQQSYGAGYEAVDAFHNDKQGVLSVLDTAPDYTALIALRQAQARAWEGVKVVRGALVLTYMRRIDLNRIAPVALTLDATTTPGIARACFGEGVHFHNIEVEKPQSLTVMNITKAMNKDVLSADGSFRYDSNRRLFHLVTSYFDSPGTLLVTPGKRGWTDLPDEAEITQALDALQGPHIYPNGVDARGSNDHEHCHTVIVANYHPPQHAIESKAADLCRLAGDVWSDTADQWRKEAYYTLAIAPQLQAVTRIRPLNSNERTAKTILLFDGEDLAQYSNILTIDEHVNHHALPLRFVVKGSPGLIFWPKLQKAVSPANSLAWSRLPAKSLTILSENTGNLDHASNHAGQTHFELKTCFDYFRGNIRAMSEAAGVQVVELQTSKGGRPMLGFHDGFDTRQARAQLREIALVEGWAWFDFGGVREVMSNAIAEFQDGLFDALSRLDELPPTAAEIYSLVGEFMGISARTFTRRMKAAGLTIDDVRGYFDIYNEALTDEAKQTFTREGVTSRAQAHPGTMTAYNQYVRAERQQAACYPISFTNPYPEPLGFDEWLWGIHLPTQYPDFYEQAKCYPPKHIEPHPAGRAIGGKR